MSTTTMRVKPGPSLSIGDWLARHWFATFLTVYGIWILLPFLAPLLMRVELDGAGKAIYFVYSFFCHQLPERSFFFFGPKSMYSLPEIQSAWQDTLDPMILRQFIGNRSMGWKVAWSDRMISFYSSVWLAALAWWPLRRKLRALPWWALALFLLPMTIDGGTHMVSDLAGIGQGFRDSNAWLAALTNNALPASFYAGDALGSFNCWMRILTGILGGLGLVWFAFPYVFQAQALEQELEKFNYGAALEQIKNKNSSAAG